MSKTKLDWKKFEPLFGTWADRIKPFFDEGGFDPIYMFLRGQSQDGRQIAPASMNTYRAFRETDYRELKCVIICQDPYAKFVGGAPVASGVAMDCSATARLQPTLSKFYGGIEKELYNGLNLNYVDIDDLSYLSKQGVMLLNTALTVEKDRSGSHMAIWHPFTTYLLKEVIGPTGVPVLFLGKEAGHLEPLVCLTNPTFTTKHPASASYSGGIWDTEGAFEWLNRHILDSNNETVSWLHIDPPF